jgi:hypothetical protein
MLVAQQDAMALLDSPGTLTPDDSEGH